MKKWIGIIAIVAVVIFEVTELLHDFVEADPVRYFTQQPSRLLLIVSIGIVGGVVALILEKLTPTLKFCIWGFALSFLTMVAFYMAYELLSLARQIFPLHFWQIVTLSPLSFGILIFLLWMEFYLAFKKRRKLGTGL